MVKILISIGYGAGFSTWTGFSTWSSEYGHMHTDKQAVKLVEARNSFDAAEDSDEWTRRNNLILEYLEDNYPEAYLGGGNELIVVELVEGTKYRIDEYDGFEELVTDEDLCFVA